MEGKIDADTAPFVCTGSALQLVCEPGEGVGRVFDAGGSDPCHARNFRLSDVAVVRTGPLTGKALTKPLLIAIEVFFRRCPAQRACRSRSRFSPDERGAHLLLDAENRAAYVYMDGGWRVTAELRVAESPFQPYLNWLWGRVEAVMPR